MQPDSRSWIFQHPVTLDSSALLGSRNWEILAAAYLGYYRGYWSTWIVQEVASTRSRWIAMRAARDRADVAEMKRRLKQSQQRVNAYTDYCSRILTLVDYTAGLGAGHSWLRDPNDLPVMATAMAAGPPGTLVTDNKRDFPWRETRNGVLFLGSADFLAILYDTVSDAASDVAEYLEARHGDG